jgi:hypothetical protein
LIKKADRREDPSLTKDGNVYTFDIEPSNFKRKAFEAMDIKMIEPTPTKEISKLSK